MCLGVSAEIPNKNLVNTNRELYCHTNQPEGNHLCYIGLTKLSWCFFIIYAVAQFVEALRYKAESREFDSLWVFEMFRWPNFSGCTIAVGSSQPATEMGTRVLPGEWRRPVSRATLPPSCADFKTSGSLSLLELSGSIKACTGTALPFSFVSGQTLSLWNWSL
jgi:hypothetical protein